MKSWWILFVALFLLADAWVVRFFYLRWKEKRYDSVIVSAAERYRVHPALVKAVVWKESAFNASIRGKAEEYGLMQIQETAALEWADKESIHPFDPSTLLDPQTNTLAGTFYLSKLLRRYVHTDNPLPYALADYNAGRSHVLRWNKGEAMTNSLVFIEQITFPGTKTYVRLVMDRFGDYSRVFPKAEERGDAR